MKQFSIIAAASAALALAACGGPAAQPTQEAPKAEAPKADTPAFVGSVSCPAAGGTATLRRGVMNGAMQFDTNNAEVIWLSNKGSVVKTIANGNRKVFDLSESLKKVNSEANFDTLVAHFKSSCTGKVDGDVVKFRAQFGAPAPKA